MGKILNLDDYMKEKSQFKIGIEFEKSDEEIKKYLDKQEDPVSMLSAVFSGYTSIEVNGKNLFTSDRKGSKRNSIESHPLVHLDSIVTAYKEKMTPDPDYSDFKENAMEYFFGSMSESKAKRFRLDYQVARNTGVGLNLAILSPDDEHVSLIWYDPENDNINESMIQKDLFKKKILDLGTKVLHYVKDLNIDRMHTYRRLVDLYE